MKSREQVLDPTRERLEVRLLRPTRLDEEGKRKNTTKSKVRAKVEHGFRILKRVFGFDKVRYRGIAKNHNRLCACFALINLYLHRKRLAPLGA
jgi:IS5 family transposase